MSETEVILVRGRWMWTTERFSLRMEDRYRHIRARQAFFLAHHGITKSEAGLFALAFARGFRP